MSRPLGPQGNFLPLLHRPPSSNTQSHVHKNAPFPPNQTPKDYVCCVTDNSNDQPSRSLLSGAQPIVGRVRPGGLCMHTCMRGRGRGSLANFVSARRLQECLSLTLAPLFVCLNAQYATRASGRKKKRQMVDVSSSCRRVNVGYD